MWKCNVTLSELWIEDKSADDILYSIIDGYIYIYAIVDICMCYDEHTIYIYVENRAGWLLILEIDNFILGLILHLVNMKYYWYILNK